MAESQGINLDNGNSVQFQLKSETNSSKNNSGSNEPESFQIVETQEKGFINNALATDFAKAIKC